jgi:hypothetical protein
MTKLEDYIDAAVKAKGPIARVIELNDEFAAELLEHAAVNRDVRPSRVARYRADMLSGHWKLNGEPLIISRDGKLVDGQHRALAALGTEAHVPALLLLGIEPDAMETMGQGIPRTAGDYLGIEGEANARTCASIARFLIAYRANDGEALKDTARATNAEVLDFYRENRDDVQRSASLALSVAENTRMLVAPSVLGFCHCVLHALEGAAAQADEYIVQVAKGELLAEGDPAFTVRTRLLNMGKSGAAKKAGVIFTGWNAFRQKRTLKTVRVSTRLPPIV